MESDTLFIIATPVITFIIIGLMITFIMRSIFRGIMKQFDPDKFQEFTKNFPKGVSMKTMKKYWAIKVDEKTGKLVVRRKTTAEMEAKPEEKSSQPGISQSPKDYEILQTIKKIAIVLLIIGFFAGIRSFFI